MRTAGIWAVVVLAAMAAYLLYPHPPRELAREGITEITFWTPMNPVVFDPMKPLLEEFEHRNPEYRVRMGAATARNAEGDPTRFLLGVAGGVPPDLILFDRFAIVEWASRGAFTDLTPYIDRDRDLSDGIRREDFFPMAWREPIYKGANFAVASSVDTRALYYAHAPLIRAGFVRGEDDPEVRAGKARRGDARPPKTWEEMLLKLMHAHGHAEPDGTVRLTSLLRRPAVNEGLAADTAVDLAGTGVRRGDVVSLLAGREVFRGRVEQVLAPDRFRIDLKREQRPGLKSLPPAVQGACEVKIFDQDGYINRLTRFDAETGNLKAVGLIPMFGNSWLYMYGWLNGARFMNPGGTRCTLDSPEIVEALQWLVDVYDAMGGIETVNVFQSGATSGVMDPFLTGKIAMRIDGNWFISTIIAFKPEFSFGVVPSPRPAGQLAKGAPPMGWGGGYAYAIPSTARHKEAAWKLTRWMSSPKANRMLAEQRAIVSRSKGQTYFPRLYPNRNVMAWVSRTYVEENTQLSRTMVEAYNVFTELLPGSKYRPVTPVGQKLWNEHVRAAEAALNHGKTPYEALSYGSRRVQTALDRLLNPPTGPVVRWKPIIAIYLACVGLLFGTLMVIQERKRRRIGARGGSWLDGYIAASPWLTGFIVFGAGPIVFSLIISFCHYDVLSPARFVGLDNYVNLIGRHYDDVIGRAVWNDPIFWKSLGNTAFMIAGVPLGIVLGLAIAVLLNTRVRGLQVYRTIFYLPAIVPAVAGFILWLWVFDPTRGLLNQALAMLGVTDLPNWLQDPAWAKPSLIIMGLWAVGSSMIIWLAGLKDIPESMYEAAAIDGASRGQQFVYITLPLLTPYIFFNMVMGMIGVFQIFEAAFIMTSGGPADSTLFYAYKLFNEAFRYLNMGAASAMAWLLFLVVLAITLTQLWLSKKWVHYAGD